jgi:hypothetical protein
VPPFLSDTTIVVSTACATDATYIVPTAWYSWCDSTAATSLAAFMTGGAGGTASNLTGSTNAIWITWTAGDLTTNGTTAVRAMTPTISVGPAYPAYQDHRTPEQKAADEARYAERLRRESEILAEYNAQHQAASARARALLLSMLEVHQREQLQRDKFFEVIARHSKRRYRIRQGTHGNVRLLDAQGREVTHYCGQPNGVPTEDCMLAQKLQIEHDEEAFLQAANKVA